MATRTGSQQEPPLLRQVANNPTKFGRHVSGRAVNRPGSRICTLLPVPMCDVDRIHAEPDAIRKRRKP